MDIILQDTQALEQIKKPDKQNQKDSSLSSSCNFERLFSEIIEVQSDIESLEDGLQKFFSQYIENITNPSEIKNTIKIIQQNKSFQEKIYDTFKLFLEEELKENREKAENGIKITKQIETKTYRVARAKDMFKELNNMMHGDIISHQKEIQKLSNEIKNIQQQIGDYEKEIEELNSENKKTYSEELNLLDTVMSFGKKLYTTYVTREEKKKEKNKLETELNQIKEERKLKEKKYQKDFDLVLKKQEKAQMDFQKEKKEIELFLDSSPSTTENIEKILTTQKIFCRNKLKVYDILKKTQKEKNSKDIKITTNELKNHIDCCNPKTLQELFNTVEIIRNVHPYLSISPNIDINNLLDTVDSICNQIAFLINEETPQEKMNTEKERQMEEIGNQISDIYYDKFIKHLFLNTLKLNVEESKKKKEAEKKLKELKNKEEKLKQLQIKYINEQNSCTCSQNSEISNSSCNSTNDDIKFKEITNDRLYPPESQKEYNISTNTSSNIPIINNNNNNTINIKIKDKKKEEKKKIKSSFNVIMEEDDSKSKSQPKMDNMNVEKEKEGEKEKEKENETTEKKSNIRQKSSRKRGKISQNKKQKKKKNYKKYDDDSLDKSYENIVDDKDENQHIFSQMFEKESKNKIKDSEKKEKQKKKEYFYESDSRKKNKNQFNFPKNNFGKIDENISETGDNFDLNDLNFLTELGEELNKSEKNYAFGRKSYYRK